MCKLNRDDYVNIQVALEHQIEKWEIYVAYDDQRPDDREQWLTYSKARLNAFQSTAKKVLDILHATRL